MFRLFTFFVLALAAFFLMPAAKAELPKDHVVLVRFHLQQLSILINDYRKRHGQFPPSMKALEAEYSKLYKKKNSPFRFVSPDGEKLAWEYHPEIAEEFGKEGKRSLIAAPVFSDQTHGKVRVDLTDSHEIRIAQVN